jgi:hypothetical protein
MRPGDSNAKIAGGTPALPFAKGLWVNSDGIHEKPKARRRVRAAAQVGSRNRDALHAGENFVGELCMSALIEH